MWLSNSFAVGKLAGSFKFSLVLPSLVTTKLSETVKKARIFCLIQQQSHMLLRNKNLA